jgi:hypothetical protein
MPASIKSIRQTLLAGLLVAAVGCGSDDGIGKRYPVSGKVTYNGKPVEKGTISFVPEVADGRPASAVIADGQYGEATTLTAGDGILPGKYKVTVSALDDVDISKAEAEQPGGAPDQVTVARIAAKAKPKVPLKYADAATSGLAFEAKAESNTFDIEMKD